VKSHSFHFGHGRYKLVKTSAQLSNLSLSSFELTTVFEYIHASIAILVFKDLLFEFEIIDLDLKGVYTLKRQIHLSDRIFVTSIRCTFKNIYLKFSIDGAN
jgi:hypothetical protein